MKKIYSFLHSSFFLWLRAVNLFSDWQRNTGLIPYGDMLVKTDHDNNPTVIRGLASGGGFTQVGTCITKYDVDGNQQWSVVDEEFFDEFGFGMIDFEFDADNNIIAGGLEMSPEDLYPYDAYEICTGRNGDLATALTSMQSWSERIEQLEVAEDGSVFAVATLYFQDVETLAQALVKISPEGNVEWINYESNEGFIGLTMDDAGMLYTTGYNSIPAIQPGRRTNVERSFGFSDDAFYNVAGTADLIKVSGEHLRVPMYGYYPETNHYVIGLVAGNTDGSNFNFFEFDILPGQDNENTNIRNFCVDVAGNTYITGNVSYGTSGPAMEMIDVERGSKGGNAVNGLLVFQVSPAGENQWTYTEFPEENEETIFSIGSAIKNDELVVVCNGGYVPTSSELVFNFDKQSGAVNWTQNISNTSVFSALFPQSLSISDDGSLYLTGNGNMNDNSQNAYLNKYQFEEETINVAETNDENSVLIYPNPACHELNVILKNPCLTVRVIDASGRTISEQSTAGKLRIALETNNLEAGIYQLVLIGEKQTTTKTFVKI